MSKDYDSNSLDNLEGLDPVRVRPGMYTDTETPNHLAQEVIDNSIDEALAGHANRIEVTIHEDDSVEIQDNGRGMPVDINTKTGLTGVAMILEMLHSGGKFSNENYKFSGGLHGVGVSVVNALSDTLDVYIKRDGKMHHTSYSNGYLNKKLTILKEHKIKKSDTGTRVHFKPNPTYFDSSEINETALFQLLKGKAILCPKLEIIFTTKKGKETRFYYEEGIQAFLDEQDTIDESVGEIQFYGEGAHDDPLMHVEWGAYFTEGNSLALSYTNLVPTKRGGTHVNSLKAGLFDGLKEYATFHNLLPKNITITANDLWQSTNYVLSFKMQDPQFSGQTKEKLSSRGCASFISTYVRDTFSLFLNKNPDKASELFEVVLNNANKRVKAAKKVKRKELGKIMPLPGKLQDCDTDHREDGELFIVEGDSAGGSAKQARDRETQAILPLRGKILNSWNIPSEKTLESAEISNIATAIGVDPGTNDLSNLRYGKICILADADSDGLHIATLFVALMLAHFPALIENGHVFVAMPPLFRIDIGKKVFYALDESERDVIIEKIKKEKLRGEINIQRFKGLGEMNPEQLAETTLNPLTRRLLQLTNENTEKTRELFDMLLNKKKAEQRRDWLSSFGDDAYIEL